MATNIEALPPRLYKFRSFGSEHKRGHDKAAVYDLLVGRLRFSTLNSFNDPFEGKPNVVAAYNDLETQKVAMLDYLSEIHCRETGSSSHEARQWASERIAGNSLEQLVELARNAIHAALDSPDVKVFCMSGEQATRAPLTWAHYADCHKGLCIHFDTKHLPFYFARRATYSEEYPTQLFPRTAQDDWHGLNKSLLWKSSLWSYEDEYRLLRTGSPEFYEYPELERLLIEWEGDIGIAPTESVVGVTLGYRMPVPLRVELMQWIDNHAAHLEIWEAGVHASRYEVTHTRIK
jgi:hypothetical protein